MDLDQARVQDFQAVEEPDDLSVRAQRRRVGRAGVDPAGRLTDLIGNDVAGWMEDGQPAAR